MAPQCRLSYAMDVWLQTSFSSDAYNPHPTPPGGPAHPPNTHHGLNFNQRTSGDLQVLSDPVVAPEQGGNPEFDGSEADPFRELEEKPPDGPRPGRGDPREVYMVPTGAIKDAYGGPAMQPLPDDWPGPVRWPGDTRSPPALADREGSGSSFFSLAPWQWQRRSELHRSSPEFGSALFSGGSKPSKSRHRTSFLDQEDATDDTGSPGKTEPAKTPDSRLPNRTKPKHQSGKKKHAQKNDYWPQSAPRTRPVLPPGDPLVAKYVKPYYWYGWIGGKPVSPEEDPRCAYLFWSRTCGWRQPEDGPVMQVGPNGEQQDLVPVYDFNGNPRPWYLQSEENGPVRPKIGVSFPSHSKDYEEQKRIAEDSPGATPPVAEALPSAGVTTDDADIERALASNPVISTANPQTEPEEPSIPALESRPNQPVEPHLPHQKRQGLRNLPNDPEPLPVERVTPGQHRPARLGNDRGGAGWTGFLFASK